MHRTRRLAEADRAVVEKVPVTAVPRVLLDLAARDRRGRLRRYMERAEELELLDLQAIQELLKRTRGHHGWGRLRRAAACSHEAFERDRLRAEDLLVHGVAMTRVTDVRFHREPDAVLARIARLLAARR